MLREDVVGASRPWRSASGKTGMVRLLEGGEKAHSSEAVVQITINRNGREQSLFIFKYNNGPKKGWGTSPKSGTRNVEKKQAPPTIFVSKKRITPTTKVISTQGIVASLNLTIPC
jgi:hypothetical protein